MEILKIEQKEQLRPEEVAARLRHLADMLANHNELEFDKNGIQLNVHVPDELQPKLELELETDERELEIELKW
jgi:amphi-Trp domain-containing protein